MARLILVHIASRGSGRNFLRAAWPGLPFFLQSGWSSGSHLSSFRCNLEGTKTSEQSREQLHIQKVNHNIKRGHVVTLEDQELLTFSSGSVMTGTGSTSMVSSQRDSVGSVARLSHHHRRRRHHRLDGVHGRRVERWKKLK